MKIWKVAIILAVAVTLGLGIGLPALAASDEVPKVERKPCPRILRGVVDTIGETSFTIQPGEQEIRVNEGTKYFKVSVPQRLATLYRHRITQMLDNKQERISAMAQRIPASTQMQELSPNLASAVKDSRKFNRLLGNLKWLRQFAEEVNFSDLAVEDKVVVWVTPSEGEPLAKVVLIMTPTPYKRLVGTIASIDEPGKIITINPLSDPESEITFVYDDGTIFVLRGAPSLIEDEKVMIIYVEENSDGLAKRVTELPEPVE